MSKISKSIKKHRSLNGMTQEELAAKIHVTRQTVSSWETDRTQPDLEILLALADVFGIEVEELIYGKKRNTAEEKEKLLFGNTLVTVISILGCLLIGAGVVMIFIKFWKSFPDALKILTCFVPALLGQSVGIYTYIKKKDSLPWCEGASVLWLLGVIVTTAVVISNVNTHYNWVSDSWMYLLFTLSALVLMLVFKTLSPLAVYQVCGALWFNFFLEDSEFHCLNKNSDLSQVVSFILVVLVQVVLIAVAFYASGRLYKKESNIIRHTFASWLNFGGLVASACFTVFRTPVEDAWISVVMLASVLCFIVGQKHTDFVSPYRVLGLPASAAALCFLAVIFSPGYVADGWVNGLMLGLGLLPIVLIFSEKTRPQNVYLRVYAALFTCALAAYNIIVYLEYLFDEDYLGESHEAYELVQKCIFSVSFLVCLAALIMLIVYGAKERKLLHLNLGFILSCVTVLAKLYLLDMGLIVTGLLLIVCGAVLLFINLKISRIREKEKLSSLAEGEEGLQ